MGAAAGGGKRRRSPLPPRGLGAERGAKTHLPASGRFQREWVHFFFCPPSIRGLKRETPPKTPLGGSGPEILSPPPMSDSSRCRGGAGGAGAAPPRRRGRAAGRPQALGGREAPNATPTPRERHGNGVKRTTAASKPQRLPLKRNKTRPTAAAGPSGAGGGTGGPGRASSTHQPPPRGAAPTRGPGGHPQQPVAPPAPRAPP